MFSALLTAMNLVGSLVALRAVAVVLNDWRVYGSAVHLAIVLASYGIWPLELWVASVSASRWLLRIGRFNVAAAVAFLPVLALLATTLLDRL